MSALSRVCQQCGLCCSGAFVTHVQLRAGESERLISLGVTLKQRKTGGTVLPLACTALKANCCTIYSQRPRGCDLYICELGQKLEAATVTEPDALAIVHEAQARIAAVEADLPSLERDPRGVMHRARSEGLKSGPQLLRDTEQFLYTHFHKPGA